MKPIPVFYRSEQSARTESASPSSHKPALVVADWLARDEIGIRIESFDPLAPEDFSRAHDARFVRDVLAGKASNGFHNKDIAIAKSLPYTSGSLLAAATHALATGEAAISPTSGFHHASWSKAQGFCTFNGLMVAACALRSRNPSLRIGILDCDAHYGNGTDDIIERIGAQWIVHKTQGALFQVRSDATSGAYARWLENSLLEMLGCDLVIYQAGADPHIDDPYGGVLTTEELARRDAMVFEALKAIPLAWNLAGGYQIAHGDSEAERLEPVLSLHRATALAHRRILCS